MRFRYLTDRLFLLCVGLYFLNRFVIKRLVVGGFFHDSFNDLICLPFWVPIMVFVLRKLGLRREDGPPRAEELLIPLVVWSVLFEVWLPHVRYYSRLTVADAGDILWYALGGLIASEVWRFTYRERGPATAPAEAREGAG
jgi:hypothetical protein